MKSKCCFIDKLHGGQGCPKDAKWAIYHGSRPDEYTESCTEHVGPLLTRAPVLNVYPITGRTPQRQNGKVSDGH